MAKKTNRTSDLIKDRKEEILDNWSKRIAEDPRINKIIKNAEKMRRESARILDVLIDMLPEAKPEKPDTSEFEQAKGIIEEITLERERRQFTPFEIASSIISLKENVLPLLQEEYLNEPEIMNKESVRLTILIDTLGLKAFDGALKRREKLITQQIEDMLELSTPIIQIWKGIVIAPLIGTLDSERTQKFKEVLLEHIVESKSPVALIDITGVPTIDTQTAQHLIETVAAVRLLGAQVILTGVRPSIAQTLIHLGITLSDITTRSSLAEGLRIGFNILNLEVSEKDSVQAKSI